MTYLTSGNRIHFGFVTDGHLGQLLGIGIILWRIREVLELKEDCPTVWLVAPRDIHNIALECLNLIWPPERLQILTADLRSSDRYFVQTGLSKVFEIVQTDDTIICLDYDHLVMKQLNNALFPVHSCVLLSSEVRMQKNIHEEVNNIFDGNRFMQALNTSLIFGHAGSLRKIGSLWVDCYEELEPYIEKRILVEYAFGLAAVRSKAKVKSCKVEFQGNFFHETTDCRLFHYGGDSPIALSMKKELYRKAVEGNGRENFISLIEMVEDSLVKMLFSFFRE